LKIYRLALWALLFCFLIGGMGGSRVYAAATITLVNQDGPNEGFNDPTPFTPVGGNNATTLGQARLNAFQHAADIWAGLLTSSVPILVDVEMNPLPFGILGGAGPNSVHRDFANAPKANTLYVQALANKWAGQDTNPAQSDIGVVFTSVDPIIFGIAWYLGLDGNPSANQADFVTVVLHELAHGLGFISLVDDSTGAKFMGLDDVYSDFLEHHGASPSDYPSMTNAQRALANVAGANLHFIGSQVVGASGGLTAGVTGTHVHMYAPNPVESGSSVSHFSDVIKPDQLMEPALDSGGAIHDVGLTWELFNDIGWSGDGGTIPASDPIFPTVQLTAPPANTTVTGSITLTAIADDNVGVEGVQFSVNGQPLGPEDPTSPYAVTWNTTTVSDGSYTLTATARDAAGNTTTSAPVIVTVSNNAPPSSPGELVISNIIAASGRPYQLGPGGLTGGALQYIDRSHTFFATPSSLEGLPYIQTANDDASQNPGSTTFLSFTVNQAVTVYVAHSLNVLPKPAWLTSFTNIGFTFISGGQVFQLYEKAFPQGTVTLGSNQGTAQSANMYTVVIEPTNN